MLSRATLRQRIQLLAVVVAVGLLVVGILGPLAIRERDAAATDLRARIEPTLRALSDLQLAMTNQESAVRGFVLTGDEHVLQPYLESRRAARLHLLRLEALTADHPQLADKAREARVAVDRWHEQAAEHEVELVRAGHADAAVAFERNGLARRLLADVHERLRELRVISVAEARAADERVAEARSRLTALLWSLALAAVAFVCATGALLRRWVTAPLERITAAVAAVTAGDRHHPIPSLGPPDIAGLATDVERMRAETVRRLDEAIRAREALEQQGPAVLTLRAELAPRRLSAPRGVDLAVAFEPAHGVLAGDWHDVIDLGGGRLALLMVDVSGHGPDAGVFALRAKHLLHAVMADRPAPGEGLAWLAERIGDTEERFLTGLIIEVDTRTGTVRYANAGHPPALLVSDRIERLGPTGPLLGPLPGAWATGECQMAAGARIVAYTDGLTEARDGQGECFGELRLERALGEADRGPEETVAAVVERVRAFSGERLADDLTMAVLALEPDRGSG